jgi:DNA-binding PucR family transcriptional regulator
VVIRHTEVVCLTPVAHVRPAALAELVRKSLTQLEQFGIRWSAGLSAVCAGLGEVARADETALRIIPSSARQLARSPHTDHRLLVDTLLACADAELNIAATSEALSVHPNTVNYRLRKMGQRLGRDLSRFSELVEVLAWFRVLERAGSVS